ncbi:MAG TPA: helix-turn-helix transcriptional regulator [Streptosporangiaceae bacterium]|nr:helix-turn-helix transcriptional regulator [Streptosporangiaceae bacterium]
MSPVFRHGSLRLYLLKLLDEEPRHGYEVIRLLRDRFMGVYSPSPGTIYPRLARLEEEGLVTHDEVDGRKVYRITDAGREELRSRGDELDELEEELSASVNDIVREVREDVRQTVRSLREELTWAARESRRASRDMADDLREQARMARDQAKEAARDARDQAKEATWQARDDVRQATSPAREEAQQATSQARDEARQAREARESARRAEDEPRVGHEEAVARVRQVRDELREQARRARDEFVGGKVHEEAASRFTGDQDWGRGWSGWPGKRGWEEWTRLRGRGGWSSPLDVNTLRDLERLAVQFATDLRRIALQSSEAGENVIGDLRVILEDALTRIRTEIFGGHRDSRPPQDRSE